MDSLPLPAEILSSAEPCCAPQPETLREVLQRIGQPFWCSRDGEVLPGAELNAAFVPALPLDRLGDSRFLADHRLNYAYVAGSMANGIASVDLVAAVAQEGMLGFFGAAGLAPESVIAAIRQLKSRLGTRPFGVNLIHSPSEPNLEATIADLCCREGVGVVEASAYLDLTLPVVRYRLAGIRALPDGSVLVPNRLIAKVSRVEVASKFLSPAPPNLVGELVRRGDITTEQARLAEHVPMADDVTAEADSAGHTDNRPALALLPTMLALRDRLQARYRYARVPRVGAAGGIGTPAAAAAAFALGAGFVVVGSVHQACVESGTSALVRRMLAEAEQADTMMAPAADMFEMGVKVQVLKRGTMFPMRAAKLYELYRTYPSLEALPDAERRLLEGTYLRKSISEVWDECRHYFSQRDPRQILAAEQDPKHRMALVFRWYLGQSSRWANAGLAERQLDFQVWCGPAMGAFNEWTRGTFLADPSQRRVITVAYNLLYGAAVRLRAWWLRLQGIAIPEEIALDRPLPVTRIRELAQL
jgi:PfaD family protein